MTADVRLTYGGLSYLDRTVPLETGEVSPAGVSMSFVRFDTPSDLFRRQSQLAEFEASEMSMSTYILLVSRGDDRFVGLPVFPSRQFRHKDVYVNADAGIDRPEDLAGRNVGVMEYQMTAALWVRAILQHDHGVAARDVHWWTGGLTAPGYVERLRHDLPPDIALDLIPPDRTLEGMLETGELDALVSVKVPVELERGSARIRRLFPDHRRVERDYLLRTGFFPIMHLVVLRRDVYERHRWMAVELVKAFARARELGWERLRRLHALAVSLPWLANELAEIEQLFDGDPFAYGVEPNRALLDAMTTYSHEQGLAERKVDVDELFAPETLVAT